MSSSIIEISSGNSALDEILKGGFTTNRVYLVDGHPGAGKTTLGLQFLMEGARNGEPGLYVSLSETKHELESVADSHDWDLTGIHIYELIDAAESLQAESQYTMFEPSEVELGETTRAMLDQVQKLKPKRIVIDSLSELRLLAQNPLRYRRQILALKQYFVGCDCTVIFLDDKTTPDNDLQLQSIAHGVISLERMPSEYGSERRRLRVVKYRGRSFQGGWHNFDIVRGGLEIYPRMNLDIPANKPRISRTLLSGNASLDQLLGSGIELGTSTLMLGPAGVGKSSCATLFAATACSRGERAVIFCFDESRQTLIIRSLGLGMNLKAYEESGLLSIVQVNPGEISPGEFGHMIRVAVEDDDDKPAVTVVVIDSLNGYLSAMPEEHFLHMQMHEMLSFLSIRNIATFLLVAQHGMLGSGMNTPVDASYLADTVMLFRYFESHGQIHQAVSVVKKRDGVHERTIREFRMENGTIRIGQPLTNFHGILSGSPSFVGDHQDLFKGKESDES